MRHVSLFVACLAFAAFAHAADPAEKRFGSGDSALVLKMPAGLTVAPTPARAGPVLIRIKGKEPGGDFSLEAVYVPTPRDDGKLSDDEMRRIVEGAAKRFVDGSVEQKATLVPLKGTEASGFSTTLTDAKPDPGQFACVTPFGVRVGDRFVAGSILHPKNSMLLPAALEMLKTATLGEAATRPASRPTAIRVPSPDGKWAVVIDLPDADEPEVTPRRDRKAVRGMTQTGGGILCTVFVEPAAGPGDAKAVRKFYWDKLKASPIPLTKVVLSGDEKVAVVSSLAAGIPDVHAYLAHDGQWVDVHLSRPAGTDPDPGGMGKIARAVHVEPAGK